MNIAVPAQRDHRFQHLIAPESKSMDEEDAYSASFGLELAVTAGSSFKQ